MKRTAWVWSVAMLAGALTGCVERRYVVYTDPPGALVLRNGVPLGASPVDDHYVYYGKYHFTIIKEGYETLQVDQEITTPWYEYFPLDFVSENLVPCQIIDRREFRFKLEPKRVVNTNELLNEAQNLRNRGISLGAGSAVVPAAGTAPPGASSPAPAPQGPAAPPP
jgi:hypothetical protein